MRLKEPAPVKWTGFRFLNPFSNPFRKLKVAVGVLLGTGILLYLMAFGASDLGRLYKNAVRMGLLNHVKVPYHYLQSLTVKPDTLTIDLKHKYFVKIKEKRETALKAGFTDKAQKVFYPAKIRFKNKTYKVKLRLKGDWIDHLWGEKWSYRVNIKGNNTLLGMKKFSIHKPSARNFIYEWIFHAWLNHEGLIGLKYEFISVVLNGKNMGVYAIEEGFDKRVIESHHRREGSIFKYNEDITWTHALQGRDYPEDVEHYHLYSNVEAFQFEKLRKNPTLYAQFLKGRTLLEKFRQNELKTSQVFDVSQLAKFFAISEILGAPHALMIHNMRFYYNPVTSLFEPIGYDAVPNENISRLLIYSVPADWYNGFNFFNDDAFVKEYVRYLEKYTEPGYLEKFFAGIKKKLNHNMKVIYKSYPYANFYTNVRPFKNCAYNVGFFRSFSN